MTQALILAKRLQDTITKELSGEEKDFHNKMQKLLLSPHNKVMLIELLDRGFRSSNQAANFDLLSHILHKYGMASFFSPFEKVLLFCFLSFGKFAPNLSVPLFIKQLREQTSKLVLSLEQQSLREHTKKRQAKHIALNLNFIGEEVLGQQESKQRLEQLEEALRADYISYVSVKITTLYSQINPLDFEFSKQELIKRLDRLYSLALEQEKKQGMMKFINLDMEEYKDLELTIQAFMQSISKFDLEAGIVLQAYIPDSYLHLQRLCEFSKSRVIEGKKPIKIRLVKGANMESEATLASQKGWELPTFSSKVQTDANYKAMLDFVLSHGYAKYVRIGIASHNIFEIAHAYEKIKAANAFESFSFEMLEGMSETCSLELSKLHKLILYAPVCDEQSFSHAIAYLVRRLDENTSDDNFMRYFFNLKSNDANYAKQEQAFLDSIAAIAKLDFSPRRKQDRTKIQASQSSFMTGRFQNEPDTDFSLRANWAWVEHIIQSYQNQNNFTITPLIGRPLSTDMLHSTTITNKATQMPLGRLYFANQSAIKEAFTLARNSKFCDYSFEEVHAMLARAAELFRQRRGDLIGIGALEVGKTFSELDAEISEAVDFLEFYPHAIATLQKQHPKAQFRPKGVGLVIAPWNFPIGISAGSISASLASKNAIIYKPSTLSSLTGYKLCECFWDAGIPKDALIFLPACGSDISSYLLEANVDFAILTGSEETAYAMLKANPMLFLSAETGGKNATIVTKFADREQAIKHVVASAFLNSGQKCSATSLLILEQEVYEDEHFKQSLVDAAKSLLVGNPFETRNKLGPLVSISNKLTQALNHLEEHEEWALRPQICNGNPYLLTPGIKYGTKEGDFTHKTELFAPILTVMCAPNLKEAIRLANSTGYGLTAGLESLDEREWEVFGQNICAGNLYINKPTTGAIVLRQPFGGIRKSAVGLGRKVGFYNYVTQFMHIEQNTSDEALLETPLSQKLAAFLAILQTQASKDGVQDSQNGHLQECQQALSDALVMAKSYAYWHKHEFSCQKDYVQVRGEANLFSYTKVQSIGYFVSKDDSLRDILGIAIGANILGIKLFVGYEENAHISWLEEHLKALGLEMSVNKQSKSEFARGVVDFERIRYFAPPSREDPIIQAAATQAKIIASARPLLNGFFELLNYHNEKSLSISYHRYGNLGAAALKEKTWNQ